jgi:hypothetical protein
MRSGLSKGHLYQRSLFAPIAHPSPEILLTCHLIYHLTLEPFQNQIGRVSHLVLKGLQDMLQKRSSAARVSHAKQSDHQG